MTHEESLGEYDDLAESVSLPQEFVVAETRAGYATGGPRDLVVWRNAMDLAKQVLSLTKNWPVGERYEMTSQVRRAAVSVPANIAEGQGRASRREFMNHLSIANGSLRELETLLELALDSDYLSEARFTALIVQCDATRRPLRGLYGYLKDQRK